MIDTANTTTTCKHCSKPIVHIPGHRRREYCNDTCKQLAYRDRRKEITGGDVTIVDDRQTPEGTITHAPDREMVERRFLNIGGTLKYPQLKNIVTMSEIVNLPPGRSSWHAFMEQADNALLVAAIAHAEVYLDVQHTLDRAHYQKRITELEQELDQTKQGRDQVQQRFTEYVRTTNEQLGRLTGELAKYRNLAELADRAKMEARFMHLGEQVEYRPLAEYGLLGGSGYWQGFMRRASDETLLKAIATAEYFLEGLIALRGDPRERRIAELERQIEDLQARLDSQESTTVKAHTTRRKKPAKPQPLPPELIYWRHFANSHNVAQNKVMQAMSAGFVHCVKGDWMLESGYPITEALDAQGRRDFWVQFHASENFRTCDSCPHTLQT